MTNIQTLGFFWGIAMAYLGSDKLVYSEDWQELNRLIVAGRHSATSSDCVTRGVRVAMETQLGLGRAEAFFRAADKLVVHPEFAAMIPVKVADYIKLQLDDKKSAPCEKAQKRENLFAVLTQLQDREQLLQAVQCQLAPKILFAIAARTVVDKVGGRIMRAEAQGAPVLVVREGASQNLSDHTFRVMVDYSSARKAETIEGGTKAITLDALKRHDGSQGRTVQDAAAVIVRMRQSFWDISRQAAKNPAEREAALRHFDASQNHLRNTNILAGCFPGMKIDFVCAASLRRDQARMAKNVARLKQDPDNTPFAKKVALAQQHIAKAKQALVLMERVHKLRSVLSSNPQARSMSHSRMQLNQCMAARANVAAGKRLRSQPEPK